MTVLYNDNKQVWQFRPSGHWNFTPESVYEVLTKFYGSDRLQDLYERKILQSS